MASGHVNRINRPNTWLLRPDLRREESPCQHGAVHTWHKAERTPSETTTPVLDGKADTSVCVDIASDYDPMRKET
jgi:hypothetical protein